MADISRVTGFPDILPPPPTSLPQTSLILKGPSEFQLRDEYINTELGYDLSRGDTNFINPQMSTYACVGNHFAEKKSSKARQGNDYARKSPRLCNNHAVFSNVDLEDGKEVVTISSCQIESTCDNMISFSLSKTKDIKSLGTSHVNPLRNTGACDIPVSYSASPDFSKKERVPSPNPGFLTPDSFISPKIKDTEDKCNVIVTPESLLRSTKIKKRSVAEELVSHSPQHQSPQVQNIETVFNQLSLGKSAFSPYGQATKEAEFRKKQSNFQTILTPENFTISDMCVKDNSTNYFSGHIRRYSENEAYLDALSHMQPDLDLDMDQDLLEAEPSGESTKTRHDDGRMHGGGHGKLPPIGVFWDIENCQVPKGLSATHVVQAVRSRFFNGYCEVEFMCVCDTLKENPKILEELNDAQVNVVHVGSTVKNAADDKLLQSMRRFADIHGAGATIVLISGDSNFATELYDLRYRKNLNVVLVHNAQAQDSLKLCAHETALFSDVTQELPQRSMYKPKFNNLRRDITVHNLPECVDEGAIRRRLHKLASNCGGKVLKIKMLTASIMFQTPDLAHRAKRRLDGEDVYGNKIYCTFGRNQNYEKEGSPKFDYPGFYQWGNAFNY